MATITTRLNVTLASSGSTIPAELDWPAASELIGVRG